jgi:hypothetical protein
MGPATRLARAVVSIGDSPDAEIRPQIHTLVAFLPRRQTWILVHSHRVFASFQALSVIWHSFFTGLAVRFLVNFMTISSLKCGQSDRPRKRQAVEII